MFEALGAARNKRKERKGDTTESIKDATQETNEAPRQKNFERQKTQPSPKKENEAPRARTNRSNGWKEDEGQTKTSTENRQAHATLRGQLPRMSAWFLAALYLLYVS